MGPRPSRPPIEGVEEVPTLDSTSALEVTAVPDHLVVVSGGYLGVEYAQMYARYGADVTVFQRGDRLLLAEEPGVSRVIQDIFEADGITLHHSYSVELLTPHRAVHTSSNSVMRFRALTEYGWCRLREYASEPDADSEAPRAEGDGTPRRAAVLTVVEINVPTQCSNSSSRYRGGMPDTRA